MKITRRQLRKIIRESLDASGRPIEGSVRDIAKLASDEYDQNPERDWETILEEMARLYGMSHRIKDIEKEFHWFQAKSTA